MFRLRKIVLLLLLFPWGYETIAQSLTEYVIVFTDKPHYTDYTPSSFLSQRAIERRQRYNIPITKEDYPVDSTYINHIMQLDTSIELISKSKWMNYIVVSCDTSLSGEIQQLTFVKQISPLHLVNYDTLLGGRHFSEITPLYIPRISATNNDEMVDTTIYGDMYQQIKTHNGHLLHHAGYQGEGMLIALLDCGYEGIYTLPSFSNLLEENRLIGNYDFVREGYDMFSNNSHGMHVLSIMASYIPYTAIGTAPKATYVIMKTEANSYEQIVEEYFLVEGLERADSIGADVINISLGYTTFNDTTANHTFSDLDGLHSVASIAASLSINKGIVVSNSAGNEGDKPWKYISIPSDAYNVLCVAAVNSKGGVASFSSRGSASFDRVKPTIASVGWDTYIQRNDGSISPGNGTSFSSPVNAGLIACLRQAYPQKTSFEIIRAIMQSCNHVFLHDTVTGYGVPDYWTAYRILESADLFEEEILAVFPNPVQSTLTIKAYYPYRLFHVEIIDTMGKILSSASYNGNDQIYIDFSTLAGGVYILRIDTGEETITKKVIKS